MFVSFARQLESESQHAIYPTPRENRLLNGHLIVGPLVETSADVRILAFVIFPHDAEIDLPRFPILKRSFNAFKKAHRAQVYVLPESTAET